MKLFFKRNKFEYREVLMEKNTLFTIFPEIRALLDSIPTNKVSLDFITQIAPKELKDFDQLLFLLIVLIKHNFVDIGIDEEIEKGVSPS